MIDMGDSTGGNIDPEPSFSDRPTLGERVDATRARAAREAARANALAGAAPVDPLPANWPQGLPGPGRTGWVERAVEEILDLSALAHYRGQHRVLVEYPCIAARVTRDQMLAEREALRAGYRTARLDLKAAGFDAAVIDQALALYTELGREWRERADQVAAVARALPEHRKRRADASPAEHRDRYGEPMSDSDTSIEFTDAELAALRERAARLGTNVHDYVVSTATGDFVDKARGRFHAWVQDPAFAEADRAVDAA